MPLCVPFPSFTYYKRFEFHRFQPLSKTKYVLKRTRNETEARIITKQEIEGKNRIREWSLYCDILLTVISVKWGKEMNRLIRKWKKKIYVLECSHLRTLIFIIINITFFFLFRYFCFWNVHISVSNDDLSQNVPESDWFSAKFNLLLRLKHISTWLFV